jgi:predicted CXXCH cytochrome family protein
LFEPWNMKTRHAGLAILILLLLNLTQSVQAAREPSSQRDCATCHIMWLSDFKRSDVETLIPYEPLPTVAEGKTDVVSTQRMCLSCHDGFVLDSRFMWQEGSHAHPVGKKPSDKIKIPLVEGKELFPLNKDGNVYCGTCHTAHGIDWEQSNTAVFMRMSNEDGQLCLSCHEEKGDGPKHGSHPILKKLDKVPAELIKAGAQFNSEGKLVCQSCHRPHGAADKKILLLNNERGQLCGSCHADRYAEDRATAGRLGTHPVNIPMDKLVLPEILTKHGAKLGEDQTLSCQSCHSPHEAVPGTSMLVLANPRAELCISCHQEQKIVSEGKHDMRLVDAANKNVRDEAVGKTGVCSACHLPHKGTGPKMWARPIDKGLEPMAALCLSCHRQQGLASKSKIGQHSHPVGVAVSNLGQEIDLPAFSREGVKYENGIQGAVSCASCHDPHRWDPGNIHAKAKPGTKGNSSNRFLRKIDTQDSQLCRSCHQQQAGIIGSKHDLGLIAPKQRNIRGQSVARSGICGTCHLVHNADGPFLWAREQAPKAALASATCASCHNPDGLAKDAATIGEHSHPLQVNMHELDISVSNGIWRSNDKQQRNTRLKALPLYDGNGRRTQGAGELGCGSCHDPHNWSPTGEKIPASQIKKTKGGPGNSFLRLAASGESPLCSNCHVDKSLVTNSKHDMTLAGANKAKQGGVAAKAAGVCLACHQPHNAKKKLLWAGETGPGQGASEVLCTGCHQADGSAGDKLTGKHSHPIGMQLEPTMRAVDLPLYALDGQQTHNKNLVDCATCHDPHRWSPTDMARLSDQDAKVEGDASNSFLRLSAAVDSKLCLQCHDEQAWVINSDHDLRISGPMVPNKDGHNVSKTGVCGQCHVPHNAMDEGRLWARFPGDKAENPADRRCLSCHRSGVDSEGRLPRAIGHPDEVTVWSNPKLPVYNSDGEKAAAGVISCASCHNPHQWDPEQQAKGPGKPVEGDVRNSFLRLRHTESFICANCHGKDSLFRYKYFHSDSTHQQHRLSN